MNVQESDKDADTLQSVHLTTQQVEVLVHLARGERYRDIANALHLASATVGYHVDKLKQLTGQVNIPALVSYGFVRGILNPERWPIEASPL